MQKEAPVLFSKYYALFPLFPSLTVETSARACILPTGIRVHKVYLVTPPKLSGSVSRGRGRGVQRVGENN